MALAHSTNSHEPSVPMNKAESHALSKHHYVPIRPAFRPLLPKACTRESSPSTGIHIHTRTTLNAGRKRVSASKADLQKRRKAYSQASMSSSKSKSELQSDGASIGSASASRWPVAAATVASITSSPLYDKDILQGQSAKAFDAASSREAVSSQGISPIDVTYQNLDISCLADSSSASPQSNILVEKRPATAVSLSSLDDAAPSTPMSIGESPTSISTASLFYPLDNQKLQGTVDPTDITVEGEGFLDETDSLSSLGPLGQFRDSTLTPPDSQKPLSAMSLGNFGPDYDEFSDLYYRADSLGSVSDQLIMNNKSTSFSEEASSVMSGGSLGEQVFADKDEDYSILEYFAPSADLF